MPVNDEEGFRREEPVNDREERARRREEPDDRDDRPRRRDERDDDDFDDRRRRIRRDNDGDATGGWIPYKNPMALSSYYCGVFGLITCVIPLGIFGILPIIFGWLALKQARLKPQIKGQAHAIIGIVLGSIEVLVFLVTWGFIISAIAASKK